MKRHILFGKEYLMIWGREINYLDIPLTHNGYGYIVIYFKNGESLEVECNHSKKGVSSN